MTPNGKPIDVKALRKRLGMSQSDLARALYPGKLTGKILRNRTRTIQRWESSGVVANAMARAHLATLLGKVSPDRLAKAKDKTQAHLPPPEPIRSRPFIPASPVLEVAAAGSGFGGRFTPGVFRRSSGRGRR